MSVEDDLLDDDGNLLGNLTQIGSEDDDFANDNEPKKAYKEKFTTITKILEAKPHPCVASSTYYKTVLGNEMPHGKEVHEVLSKFLKAKTNDERNASKKTLIQNLKELYKSMILKVCDDNLPIEKLFFLRYRLILPSLISEDQRKIIGSIVLKNEIDEAVWYADEWIKMVAMGEVNPLATDEKEAGRANPVTKNRAQLEKLTGQHAAQLTFLQNQNAKMAAMAEQIASATKMVALSNSSEIKGVSTPLADVQVETLSQLYNLSKALMSESKNYKLSYNKYLQEEVLIAQVEANLNMAGGDGPSPNILRANITKELTQIEALMHICVGRNGNPLNMLLGQLMPANIKEIATRENIVKMMEEIEKVDVEIFIRNFRRQINRIPPHVILLPCFGNTGACWEAFERNNKATSRGRIAVPMFPRSLKAAVVSALAVYRWESAKAMASQYWMEEGLTGQFYQYFVEQKMKGDIKEFFIENYTLWITYESDGVQKLEKEIRGIFWRNTPFSEEKREDLKRRGFVYEELYKKDLNRKVSQG